MDCVSPMNDKPHPPDRVITSAGVHMPRILYGTAWKQARTAALVTQAITLGFRGIDTACQPKHYFEAGVGAGIAAVGQANIARAALYLQTKFTPLSGQDPARMPYTATARPAEQVMQSFETSLHNLQTPYVDGLILHSPLADAAEMREVWQAMEAIWDGGRARQLGISNCYQVRELEALYRGARIKPAVVQNRFHARTQYDSELRAFCRRHGILYQSFWTLTANPQVLTHSRVRALASKHRRTAAQILFRYLTQIDIVPLIGATSMQHMREDLAIFEFQLSVDEQAGMATVFR